MPKKLFDAALLARAEGSICLNRSRAMNRSRDNGRDGSWYKVARANKSDEVDVFIYDEIGFWGVQASDFVAELKEIDTKTINLRVNSPGGSVFDGLAIYQAFASHPAKIIAYVDGWAASIASVIIMAADTIKVGEAAQVMIHKPWSFAMGSADDMRKEADVLDSIQEAIIDVYVARTGGDRDSITSQVNDETWFRGQEAVDAGFADEVIPLKLKDPANPAASFDSEFFASIFPNIPDDIKAALPSASDARITPIEPFNFDSATEREFQNFLRQHGASGQRAKAITSSGFKAATESPEGTKQADAESTERLGAAVKTAVAAAAIRLAAQTNYRK